VSVGVLALAVSGCSDDTRETPVDATIVLVDALGDTVALPYAPRSIVSLAPSLTELVFVLGREDRLVGVTEYCDYPPNAKLVPRVSGFNIINHEAIIAKHAELALGARGNPREELKKLKAMNVPVFTFEITSLNRLVSAAGMLGRLLGCAAVGDSVSASWRRRIDDVVSRVGAIPEEERLGVFFGGVDEPLYTVGPGGFIHDVIETAGGRNIFGDMGVPWPRVDLETVVARNPDVIVATGMIPSDTERIRGQLHTAPGWRTMAAAKNDRLVVLGDAIMRDGPRLIDALELLARELYPDRFEDG